MNEWNILDIFYEPNRFALSASFAANMGSTGLEGAADGFASSFVPAIGTFIGFNPPGTPSFDRFLFLYVCNQVNNE